MLLNWNPGKHARQSSMSMWRTRRLWLWSVLRKVMFRPESERSWARLSMELTCPYAGRGKIRTWGAFDLGSIWARSRVLIAKFSVCLWQELVSYTCIYMGWYICFWLVDACMWLKLVARVYVVQQMLPILLRVNYIIGPYPIHYILIWSITFQLCQFGP